MVDDPLIGALTTRLRRFTENGDPSTLLDPAAIAETANLRRIRIQAGTGKESRWDVLAAVANLYLGRWQALPGDEGKDDAQVAFAFCSVLAATHPDAIPKPLQDALAGSELELPDDVELLTMSGHRAFEELRRTGHAGVLDAAVDALANAAAFTPPGGEAWAGRLSDLGLALFTRSQVTGSDQGLDAAIDAGRRSVAVTRAGHHGPARLHGRLGTYLAVRFELRADPRDLDAAIESMRQAAASSLPGDPPASTSPAGESSPGVLAGPPTRGYS